MIRIKLGIPASGKTVSSEREVVRVVGRGGRVLWLTPLKADVKRMAEKFARMYGIPSDRIFPIPSKLESCPALRDLLKDFGSVYHVLIGVAMCLACRHRACVFKSFVQRAANREEEGLFIATHRFLWLGLFFERMYIDEMDFLVPSMFEVMPASRVEALLRAIEKVFGEDVARGLRKRYLVRIDGDRYLFKAIFPFKYFYVNRELVGISATLQRGSDIMAAVLGFDTVYDLLEAEDAGEIQLYVDTLPTPQKPDVFYILRFRNYWTSPHTKRWYVRVLQRAKQDVAHGYTVTIVARSKREARILHSMLSRNGLEPLTEGVNWFLTNYDEWRRRSVRILVVRGRFHRALNIESDRVYAFYQHVLPGERRRVFEELEPIWRHLAEEIIVFDEYRAHVQTVFRCARRWTKRHEFYLLDSKYEEALMYFDHIYDFTRRRTRFVTDIAVR